jgi:aerobic-type carbon monoxide dehydrogenase small subunit (CoxS/CutS family)
MAIDFELNGAPTRVDAASGTPLLWVLRDVLNLTGTKYGCGMGLCGACTVHVDDEPVRSCMLPIDGVRGRRVRTIEGLGAGHDGGRHPVQRAWLEVAVPQCGYCQSGQIMCAAALLARTPQPDDAAIDSAMAGVLCRCGTYQRIRAAIHRAAGN